MGLMGKILEKLTKQKTKKEGNALKKVHKKKMKPHALAALEKSRPKRYMNAFLCYAQDERRKAKIFEGGNLLNEWKAAHKGLGAKWKALGTARAKFPKQEKVPAFAMFIKEQPRRKQLLPLWRLAHKALGARWKGLDKTKKARYVAQSQKMKVA